MKKIIISESKLKRIIDNKINEQATLTPSSQGTQQQSTLQPTTAVQSGTYQNTTTKPINKSFDAMCKILSNARNISWADGIKKSLTSSESDIIDLARAIITWCKSNKYDPKILKASIGVLFRESKASSYAFLQPKEMYGAVTNAIGFDPLNYKNGFKADHSQGYAQIKPSTAKSYGIDMKTQSTFIGALDGAYKMLSKNYQNAQKFYSGPSVTIYQDKKYLQAPGFDNDAALYMTVASHNAGAGIMNKWCETNIVGVANKCSLPQRKDIYKKGDGIVAVTNTAKPINNYFPNIGNVHNYMPQFRKSYDALSSLPSLISTVKIT
jgi:hypothetical protein